MFTNASDKVVITWVKQGSDVGDAPARFALTEMITEVDPFPKSSLGFNSNANVNPHFTSAEISLGSPHASQCRSSTDMTKKRLVICPLEGEMQHRRPLNRGLAMENLQIEVPGAYRRHALGGGLGMRTCARSSLKSAPASSHMLAEQVLSEVYTCKQPYAFGASSTTQCRKTYLSVCCGKWRIRLVNP